MNISNEVFYQSIREVISQSRERVYRAVNTVLLETYWQIGKIIVEEEQNGSSRAVYGSNLLKNISKQLTLEFGKGFDESNLRNMRIFYRSFPIRDALCHKLSWTHYRKLSKIEDEEQRLFYLNEAAENGWNYRQLERQIKTLTFNRMLYSKDEGEKNTIHTILKDPYIFEFLGLSSNEKNTEF